MTTERREDLPPESARERQFERMARERQEDRREGRPERGLFSGRGPAEAASTDEDEEEEVPRRARRRRVAADDDIPTRPQTGMKRSVLRAIRQIPAYLRLLIGLVGDGRVSKFDRFLVLAAGLYMVSPVDFIPDLIPFLGEVDDLFLLMTALQRLVANAGRTVLLDHWRGDPDELEDVNLARLVSAAGFFLPVRLRRRLRKMAGG